MPDSTNPEHYQGHIECIEAIEASMTPEAFKGFMKGNILKYVWRYEKKNGIEDLRKAQWYLNRLIGTMESEQVIYEEVKEALGVNYDPDDYMASGCPDGFCPMPNYRQGPAEPMFPPAN